MAGGLTSAGCSVQGTGVSSTSQAAAPSPKIVTDGGNERVQQVHISIGQQVVLQVGTGANEWVTWSIHDPLPDGVVKAAGAPTILACPRVVVTETGSFGEIEHTVGGMSCETVTRAFIGAALGRTVVSAYRSKCGEAHACSPSERGSP